MKTQIERLETRIEKIQEMFTKDLQDLKNRQSVMNNTEPEMENTLVGTKSRTAEAEEWLRGLKDRMVEIPETAQSKEKRIKRNEDSLRRPLGQH